VHFAQASADDVLDEDRDEYLDRRVAELVCGFVHPAGDQRDPLGLGVAGQPGSRESRAASSSSERDSAALALLSGPAVCCSTV
jgi:hypothetical protein